MVGGFLVQSFLCLPWEHGPSGSAARGSAGWCVTEFEPGCRHELRGAGMATIEPRKTRNGKVTRYRVEWRCVGEPRQRRI